MTAQEKAWQAAESAAAALAPDADVFGSVDAAGLGSSTFAVLRRAAAKPTATTSAAMRFWTSMAMAGPVAAARWMGMDAPPPVPVPESDKRFTDKTWSDNPAFYALRQAHLATSRLVSDLLEAGSGDTVDDAKAALTTSFLLDALAPTNFLLTNPAALKRMFETGGAQPLRRRRAEQQRPPAPGRHPAVPGRREPRRHDGQGRVPERPDGAHPVRAADTEGPLGPGAGQPAVDQQVLRHGPGTGPQLPGVGGQARAHRVRDLLPQPGCLDGRHHLGRLPHPRAAGCT